MRGFCINTIMIIFASLSLAGLILETTRLYWGPVLGAQIEPILFGDDLLLVGLVGLAVGVLGIVVIPLMQPEIIATTGAIAAAFFIWSLVAYIREKKKVETQK